MTVEWGSSPFLHTSAKITAIVASSSKHACKLLRTDFDLTNFSDREVLKVVDRLHDIRGFVCSKESVT